MTNPVAKVSLRRLAEERAASSRGRDEDDRAATPGDVFVLPETSEQPVHWVVLARDPARPGQLLVVVADANQLVGSHDLEIGNDTLGPLVLRPPFGGWLEAGRLDLELRVGHLRLDHLSTSRNRWFGEAPQGSIALREVDDDPEYRDWCESVLVPAHRTLFKEADPRQGIQKQWVLVAAVAALVLGLVGMSWFHQQRLDGLRQELVLAEEHHARELGALNAGKEDLIAQHQVALEAWEERLENNRMSSRSAIQHLRAELQEARSSAVIANPVVKVLSHATTRGRTTVELFEDSTHVIFLLLLDDPSEADDTASCELTITEVDSRQPVFSTKGLKGGSHGEVAVGVPVARLKRGLAYDLALEGEEGANCASEGYQIRIAR